eukprot:357217-Chlamydomonas_euryale.AAC.2
MSYAWLTGPGHRLHAPYATHHLQHLPDTLLRLTSRAIRLHKGNTAQYAAGMAYIRVRHGYDAWHAWHGHGLYSIWCMACYDMDKIAWHAWRAQAA